MPSKAELLGFYDAARPLIETSLEVAEQMAELRDSATEKGFDWSQIKALVKARILDEQDGKNRVAALIERADHAMAYAEMLGLMNEDERKKIFSPSPPIPAGQGASADADAQKKSSAELEIRQLAAAANASDDTPVAISGAAGTMPLDKDGWPEMPAFMRKLGAAIESTA